MDMASGDPLDLQREKRWPKQTPSGSLRVQRPEDDFEDDEDAWDDYMCYPYNPKTGYYNEDWLKRQQPNAKDNGQSEVNREGQKEKTSSDDAANCTHEEPAGNESHT